MARKDASSNYSTKLPRPRSLNNRIHADERTREKDRKRMKRYNKYFMIPLYELRLLPLIGLGRFWLLLQHKGRKRTTPVLYYRIDDVIHIFSTQGEKTDWMKNVRANPDEVYVQVELRKFHAKVEIVDVLSERENFWRWFVLKHPRIAKSLIGWNPKHDNPETIDLSFITENITVVRLGCPSHG